MPTLEHSGVTSISDLKRYAEKQSCVRFPNGCYISFDEDEWEGSDPYGSFGFIEHEERYEIILNWIKSWDTNKDEKGNLIEHDENK